MMSEVTAARIKLQAQVTAHDSPALLCELEPWRRVFFRNLADFLLRREPPPVATTASPLPLRRDYFIQTGIAPARFAQSYAFHIALITLIYLVCSLPFFQRAPKLNSPFHNTQITYYPVSDYLPPIDTAPKAAMKPRHGAPQLARQQILSVPAHPDNTRQTIVTAPKIKLNHAVPLPNIVAWTSIPAQPVTASAQSVSQLRAPLLTPEIIAPTPEVSQLKGKLRLPPLAEPSVVAPTTDISQLREKLQLHELQPSVVEPALSADQLKLKRGELNMAQLQPTVAAPKLPVAPQRAAGVGKNADKAAAAKAAGNIPPSPSVAGLPAQGQGQLIALGLNPVDVHRPINVPNGNRSGEFHASPSGKANAPGTPNISGTGTAAKGGGNGKAKGVPPGIVVGAPPPGATTAAVAGTPNPAASLAKAGSSLSPERKARERIIAEAMKPSLPTYGTRVKSPPPEAPANPDFSLERRIFGARRSYSLIMNMPNLTSATGSWIIRFAEVGKSADDTPLTAPVAMTKVDPAYPADALRDNVEGTVTLYAIIRADGTVHDIRVLDSLDPRLDASAARALSAWRFRPGTKNGEPVAVEAIVQIPFRKHRFGQ
jgi:TonB family protein